MPGLYLPPSHKIHERPVKYECALCGHPFYEGEQRAFERHVLKDHDHAEIRSHSHAVQAPGLFDPNWEGGDVEWGRWIAKNNATRPDEWMKWMKTGDGKSSSGLGDG